MRKLLKILGVLVGILVLVVAGVYIWATVASNRMLATTFETHRLDFPIPFPLDADEVVELELDEATAAELAMNRAIARGQHLVNARYGCIACHGQNFGGGVMVDAFPIGRLLAPNLTLGAGSRTADYTPADWDRIVRHGVLPDGRPAVMPSQDFFLMTDQELSDIIAFIRAMPAVDNVVPPPALGPLGKFLVATGELPASATLLESHTAAHATYPPDATASAEFGRHLAGVCMGCHGPTFEGGPIAGGDPAWPPARNLTPDPSALGLWSFAQFVSALRDGVRPDGTLIQAPMTEMAPFARQMTDVELQALWLYLQSLPPVPAAAE